MLRQRRPIHIKHTERLGTRRDGYPRHPAGKNVKTQKPHIYIQGKQFYTSEMKGTVYE